MIRQTFLNKGLAYAGDLAVQNLQDLHKILEWNYEKGIDFYRMSSNMFPWMSEYELEDLPQFPQIRELLARSGKLAQEYNQRLTFHPGPFNVLASTNEEVVRKTIRELDQHAKIMDLMQLSPTVFNKINIHVGSTLQGNKEQALQNFCNNYQKLQASTRNRLTVENDDKANMYSIKELHEGIHQALGIPLVFDFHHHLCHPGGQSQEDALKQALSTWPCGIKPVVHYSEPKSLEDRRYWRAHADFIEHKIPTYGQDFDIMIEAKQKECALIHYKELKAKNSLGEAFRQSLGQE